MRHLALRLFTPLLLTVLLLAGMGHGQFTDQVIKVNIPFDFEVGNMTFPAGMYSLVRTQPHILRLRNSESRVLATLVTGPVETATAPSSPKLDFYFEGGRHILARVWQRDDSIGQELYPGKPATLLAKRRTVSVPATTEGSQP
jgi:hypothetical protein